MAFDTEFSLILRHTVKIARRSGFTTTAMGQRRSSGETVITDGACCYYFVKAGKRIRMPSGDFKEVDATLMMKYSQDVQEGDLVYVQSGISGFTLASVMAVEPIMDFDGNTHHIEVDVEKLG